MATKTKKVGFQRYTKAQRAEISRKGGLASAKKAAAARKAAAKGKK